MTKQVQRRRGTAAQHTSFTGAEGEISVNTTNKSVHVHDGTTAGGIEAARADLGNVSDANLNAALSGNTLASLTITSADINGGTIDGAVIGGSTPAAISGTTGTFSGNLTVDTNTLFVDAANNRVGVGTVSPAVAFGVAGNSVISGASPFISLAYNQAGATPNYWQLGADGVATLFNAGTGSNGAWKFDIGGGSEAMRITSTGSVGIGTSSPASGYRLDVAGAMRLGESANLSWGNTYADNGPTVAGSSAGGFLAFYPNGAASGERMRITSTGSVGIGTSSPAAKLEVTGDALTTWETASTKFIGSKFSTTYDLGMYMDPDNRKLTLSAKAADSLGTIAFETGVTPTERMRVTNEGRVGIGTPSPAYNFVVSAAGASGIEFGPAYSGTANLVQHYSRSGGVYVDAVNDAAQHRFNIAGSERARIDASGNVGIGTSTPDAKLTVAGAGITSFLIDGRGSSAEHYTAMYNDTGGIFFGQNAGALSLWLGADNTGAGSAKAVIFSLGSTVFNENGGDADFRIESVGNTHALFVDASANAVGIGTSSPTHKLTVGGYSNVDAANKLAIGDNAGYQALIYMESANETLTIENTSDYAGRATIFKDNGTERMRINASGNVGIGTASPAAPLHVFTTGSEPARFVRDLATDAGLSVQADNSGPLLDTIGVHNLRFFTNGAERARIDASGYLLIGSTGGFGTTGNQGIRAGSAGQLILGADSGGLYHQVPGNNYYLVTTSGGGTSDASLKTNVSTLDGALSKVCRLRGVAFEFIEEPMSSPDKGLQIGVIAQEIEAEYPEVVVTSPEGIKSVRYEKLVAPLIEAIKELKAEVDSLRAQINP